MGEKLFHGDETRWQVFEEVEGKTGYRWYLWGNAISLRGVLPHGPWARSRGAQKGHVDKLQRDLVEVVLVCDRYSAYKSFAKRCGRVDLSLLLGACAA